MSETSSDNPPVRDDARRSRIPPWSWAVLISALAWAVIIITIPPASQNFPLGDDWAFARGAIWFAHGDGIHYSHWASMPQLGQWLWSWPFLHVISSPHFALRLSVITLSWLGLVAFYDLLRQQNVSARLAGFAACALAMNPLFFVSQGTYMTDVPALSFGLLALNAYACALNQKDLRWLAGAVALAVLGAITRQTMIAVPIAAAVAMIRRPEVRQNPLWALSVIVPIAACVAVSQWFSHRPDVLPMQLTLATGALILRPFIALHWCGLVVFPMWLLTLRRKPWKEFALPFAIMLLAAGYVCSVQGLPYGHTFPYTPGMISPWGTFSNGLVAGAREILLTRSIRIALTLAGCIGGAEILSALTEAIRARKLPGLLPLFTALEFLALLTLPDFMDRYVEVLFPGTLFLVAARNPVFNSTSGWLPGAVAVALSALISVGLFHDWLSWNTARWELGRRAVATEGIPPNDIEGGFEWNGWYASVAPGRPLVAAGSSNAAPGLSLRFSRYFFPQVTGRFALTFTPLENSVIKDSASYSLWLPPRHKGFLFVAYTGQ